MVIVPVFVVILVGEFMAFAVFLLKFGNVDMHVVARIVFEKTENRVAQ